MLVLGVHDGTHDAGAAVVRDGVLVAACNEERFTREKGAGGWPAASIRACLEPLAGQPLDRIAFPGFVNPNPALRGVRPVQKRFKLDDGWFYHENRGLKGRFSQWMQFESPFPRLRSDDPVMRALGPALRGLLGHHARASGLHAPVDVHDHHLAHAAAAWYTSGEADALVIVADGVGDGLALTVYRGQGDRLDRLAAWPYPHSYGLLYATLTGFLGFRPFRHEGKLTGLAALGDPDAVQMPFPFVGPPHARRFTERFGAPLRPWLDKLRAYRREDVCAWLQRGLEREIGGLVAAWIERTGVRTLALAGGVFANVRLNQHVATRVDRLTVFPNMGDGGLAAGAAFASWAAHTPGATPRALPHAFLGPSWDAAAIEADLLRADLLRSGVVWRRVQDLEEQVARKLAAGQIVARFDGAMEYGPRALGNRSILAAATDRRMTDRLNVALSRSEFMPFAPAMLAEDADAWVEGLAPVRHAARFMTVTVQARPAMAALCPATVHADGSLRPQLVDAATSPGFHRTLSAYRALTGAPALLNTSFNLHEEPIVRSPAEAIATFRAARIDALAIGPFLVTA